VSVKDRGVGWFRVLPCRGIRLLRLTDWNTNSRIPILEQVRPGSVSKSAVPDVMTTFLNFDQFERR